MTIYEQIFYQAIGGIAGIVLGVACIILSLKFIDFCEKKESEKRLSQFDNFIKDWREKTKHLREK